MKKFDTKVQHLKYKVLREVAKHAWNDTLTENVLEIPKQIVPGKTPTMRCCVYKERAIIKNRVIAGLGYSIEEDDETVSLAKYAKKAVERKEIDAKHLTVFQSACKGCNRQQLRVLRIQHSHVRVRCRGQRDQDSFRV